MIKMRLLIKACSGRKLLSPARDAEMMRLLSGPGCGRVNVCFGITIAGRGRALERGLVTVKN